MGKGSASQFTAEFPFFLPSEGGEIFALLGEARGPINLREGVIICPADRHETKKCHWTLRQIGWRLQELGYTTLRFDYYASGDSSGRSEDYDLKRNQQNIRDAIAYLKASGLVRRLTVVAFRVNAPLVLHVLTEERVKKLVLVDPVLDGVAYVENLRSLHHRLLNRDALTAPFDTLSSRQGQLLGYPTTPRLIAQWQALSFPSVGVKIKSLHLLQSLHAPPLDFIAERLRHDVDGIEIHSCSDNLKWDQLDALEIQDFPREFLNQLIEAVRSES